MKKKTRRARVRAQGSTKVSGKRDGSRNARVRALVRAQEMNEMLKKSIIESEALQSSGDDRPWGEQHVYDLLAEEHGSAAQYKNIEPQAKRTGAQGKAKKGRSRKA